MLPEGYGLNNYPNPFNGSTRIVFEIPKMHHVEITVYEANGEMIEKLYSRNAITGIHEVNWYPQNVSSGIYFISVAIDGLQTKLIKASYLK